MAFDFDYLEDLKRQQLEEEERQHHDEDEETSCDEADADNDFVEEATCYADFIRDIVHPDLNLDEIVAELEIDEEDIADHLLSTEALALEYEYETQDSETHLSEASEVDDAFDHLDTDTVVSEQSFNEIIAEVQEHEDEFIEHFDQDAIDSLLDDSSTDQSTDVEVTSDSLTQLLVTQPEELEVQETDLAVIEDELEEELKEEDTDDTDGQFLTMDLSTSSEQVVSDDYIEFPSSDFQERIEDTGTDEFIGSLDIPDYRTLQDLHDLQPVPEEPVSVDFREIQDEHTLLDLQTIQELIRDHQALGRINEYKELEEIDEVDELQSLESSDDVVCLDETESSLEKTTADLEDATHISLDEVFASLPVFSSLEPINEADLLESLVTERTALEEELHSPSYQDPEKLSLNELHEYTEKQYELESLHQFIELVPLFSEMDTLSGKDFLVFEDEHLFQECINSQLEHTEDDFLTQPISEVGVPHFLNEFIAVLPEITHGPYIVDPPPYNFLEELDFLLAQSDQAAPPSSTSIVDNFERGREAQLKATIDFRKNNSTEFNKNAFPSFVKRITPKKGKKTGIKNPWGDIMLPSKFLKETLPMEFPGFQQGDIFQVEIVNLRIKKTGIHTCKVSRRIQFTRHLSEYFNHRIDDLLEIKFQKRIPKSMTGKYSNLVSIGRFVQYSNSNMVNVQLSKTVTELLNSRSYPVSVTNQNIRKIHWRFKSKEGLSSQYNNKTIGITPARLGLVSQSQNFCAQITIISSNLSSNQVDKLTEDHRTEFVTKELNIFKEATGFLFTGISQNDKEPMLEFVATSLVKEYLFDDVEEIGFHVPIKDPDGKEYSKRFVKPDGLLKRINNPQPELVEVKAFKSKGIFNVEETCGQIRKYRSLGYRVNLITTLNRRDIPRRIQDLCDSIYAYEDLVRMIAKSKSIVLGPMVESIRKAWP